MIELILSIRLLDPWFALTALLVPLAWRWRRRSPPASVNLASAPLLPSVGTPRTRLATLGQLLQNLAIILAVLALSRPVRRIELPKETRGIDVLLVIDLSSSMAEKDMDPKLTRLEVAKAAANRFIDARREDRIGLVGFARYPELVCPLTLDHDALKAMLGALQRVEHKGPEDATGIGRALARGAELLRRSEAESKLLLLLTDGAENIATARTPSEIAPLHAAQLCEESSIQAHVILAGKGERGRDGNWVPLDTSRLERVVARTSGKLFEAPDATTMDSVYEEIDLLQKESFEEPRHGLEEIFRPFLLAAALLLVSGALLDATLLRVLP